MTENFGFPTPAKPIHVENAFDRDRGRNQMATLIASFVSGQTRVHPEENDFILANEFIRRIDQAYAE